MTKLFKNTHFQDLKSEMLEMRQGINECQTNPCQYNGTCQGSLLMQGCNKGQKSGGAGSNAARRRCPAAPSDLPKSGGAPLLVAGLSDVFRFYIFWPQKYFLVNKQKFSYVPEPKIMQRLPVYLLLYPAGR